ncbi:glycosyltransferase family 39 protein [Dehalogenimonas alkenigignens]|uniref:glycosyltransferase family 39 protein n=1 Tax=Dehalogenimonas alkenigignens TaxID=1217799 RepID=UPI001403E9A6|nr:glycosyltransferase family 39 protein [Dehalogenimonas alkenigignens]
MKSAWSKVKNHPHFWLGIIVALNLALHFAVIQQPPDYVFDEKWYAADAGNNIIQGKGTYLSQHPPLGKLIITGGIAIFGDNPFGWRIFPVLFGAAGLVLFYLICRQLTLPNKTALLATFLLSVENLTFIQASVAMLDVFSVTLMLAAFLTYLKGRYLTTTLLIALSALAKFTGVFAVVVIGLHWLATNRKDWKKFIPAMAAVPAAYLLLLIPLDLIIWGKFINPISETVTMLTINVASTFAEINSTILSRPLDWVMTLEMVIYWLDPNYLAIISPSLWAFIIPAMGFVSYKAFKGSRAAVFCAAWFTGTYLIWIPLNLITDRTTYIFYFYPTVGAICLAVVLSLEALSTYFAKFTSGVMKALSNSAIPVFILLHLAAFVHLSPVPYLGKLGVGILLYSTMRMALSENNHFNVA